MTETINTRSPKFKQMMKLFNDTDKMGYRHTYVFEATLGRSESTKDLLEFEVDKIIAELRKAPSNSPKGGGFGTVDFNEQRKKMRNKITHYLCLLGYEDENGKADYPRIDRFIVNIGSRNPRKVILNYLYPQELNEVLNQVETMYKKELSPPTPKGGFK